MKRRQVELYFVAVTLHDARGNVVGNASTTVKLVSNKKSNLQDIMQAVVIKLKEQGVPITLDKLLLSSITKL